MSGTQADVLDDLAARFHQLSLYRHTTTDDTKIQTQDEVDDVTDMFDRLSLSPKKPTARFHSLPPELILQIFYHLVDSSSSIRDVSSLATASKYLHSCLTDSLPAILCRAIKPFILVGPGLCDLVIKVGIPRSVKRWPTDVSEIKKSLTPFQVLPPRLYSRYPGPKVDWRSFLQPSMLAGIVTWVRSGASKFDVHEYDIRRARDRIQGLPKSSKLSMSLARHPYDCMYFVDSDDTDIESEDIRAFAYCVNLDLQLAVYEDHLDEPWTDTEEGLFGTEEYVQCCLLEDCPRRSRAAFCRFANSIRTIPYAQNRTGSQG
jgi:hypothetical protein